MENLFLELFQVSIMGGAGILVISALSMALRKNHTVFWRYCLWLLLAVRLVLPFDFSIPGRGLVISLPIPGMTGGSASAVAVDGRESDAESRRNDPMGNILTAEGAEGKAKSHDIKDPIGSGEMGVDSVGVGTEKSAKAENGKTGGQSAKSRQSKTPQGMAPQSGISQTMAYGQEAGIANRVLRWAAIVWAVGAALRLIWQMICYALFSRQVKRTGKRFGKKGELPVYISPASSSPMLAGIYRPRIILPHGKYGKEELAFILEHEYIHYRRKDLWAKMLLAFAKTLHWFNPLVYWMERQAVRDMELLCDSHVVRHFSREEKKRYGAALLNCASSKRSRTAVLCTSEFSRDARTLKERLANIFSGEGKKRGVLVVVLGAVCLMAVSMFVMFGATGNGSRQSGDSVSEKTDAGDPGEGDNTAGAESGKQEGGGKSVEEADGKGQEGRQLGDDSLFSRLQTYTWQEITVSIPDAWEGKYQVEESEDGFALMQKASYEKHEGMGMLCGFYRMEGMVIDYAGATPLAFTGTHTYYMSEPTDVNYYYEDEEIAREYQAMHELVRAMASTVTIDKEGVKENPEEYVLPLSNTVSVNRDVLLNFADNELKIARNEIYARHGRQFRDPYLAAHFDSCSWYQGTVPPEEFDEGVLSQTEKENLKVIQKAEEAYRAEHPYPKAYQADSRASEDLDQDGRAETISCKFRAEEASIVIDGTEYVLSDMGVQLITPDTEVFYVTDIASFDEKLEIALLDYGPSDDPETHFFSYKERLHYLGSIPGFPFAEQTGYNGFGTDGYVITESRIDFTHTSYVYDYWWYDDDGQKLIHDDIGYYGIVPEAAHALSEDITVYLEMDETRMKNVLPAQEQVFFLETDGKEWVLVKGKDGTKGYVHIVDGKIKELSKTPGEVFSGLEFAG
ncbi:MAG TPA: hypothetical protein DF613_14885 [Lachnospiraceae bacterium]|nr:hypothetical protein [Lachnospiraceae bacterium]